MKISAAILAGGTSRRMGGSDKAFIHIKGRPIIERSIATLGAIFGDVCVVTNNPDLYRQYESTCTLVTDRIRSVGPLGGLYTALASTDSDAVFVISCDMPFMHRDVVQSQIDDFDARPCDALVPRIGMVSKPLHAIYRTDIQGYLYRYLSRREHHSLDEFLEAIDVRHFDLRDDAFYRDIFCSLHTVHDVYRARLSSRSPVRGGTLRRMMPAFLD